MVYYLAWVTVSAKIRRNLYEKIKKYSIPVSDVIRKALIEEVQRREEEEARRALRRAQEILKKIPSDEVVTLIRSSREER